MSLVKWHLDLSGDRIPTDFHQEMLCGLLFLSLLLCVGDSCMNLIPHISCRGSFAVQYLSGFSAAATPEYKDSSFHVFTTLTSIYVDSSVNPWLLNFSLSRLQLVIQVNFL